MSRKLVLITEYDVVTNKTLHDHRHYTDALGQASLKLDLHIPAPTNARHREIAATTPKFILNVTFDSKAAPAVVDSLSQLIYPVQHSGTFSVAEVWTEVHVTVLHWLNATIIACTEGLHPLKDIARLFENKDPKSNTKTRANVDLPAYFFIGLNGKEGIPAPRERAVSETTRLRKAA